MESLRENKVNFDDCILAHYAELMESKEPNSTPTVNELASVGVTAAEFYLGATATKAAVESLATSMSHPYGRLWMAGLLDTTVYFEWAYSVEHAIAVKDVAKALDLKR